MAACARRISSVAQDLRMRPLRESPGLPANPRKRLPAWRLGFILLIIFLACVQWGMVRSRHPTVVLPDGVRVSYYGSSHGVTMGTSNFHHTGPPAEEYHPFWLHWLRSSLPPSISSHLPAPIMHRTGYPAWPDMHEFELQFQTKGNLSQHPWDIFVADEHGWETRVRDYTWSDNGAAKSTGEAVSGWLRLGSAYPRRSKTIRIVFHPNDRQTPKPDRETRLKPAAQMIVPNPFWQASSSNVAEPLPLSLPFRGETLTLKELRRDRIVGDGYGALHSLLVVERDGKPLPGFEVARMSVSDSSGQVFRQTTGGSSESSGRMWNSIDTAPWSDDPCWLVRYSLCRKAYSLDVPEDEQFKFEGLPLPSEAPVKFERKVTCRGMTLSLGKFTQASDAPRFLVSGLANDITKGKRIILLDARDDQGRTETSDPRFGRRKIVGGPVGGSQEGMTYSLNLPADAKSWSLTLLVETLTEVEFRVRSPLADAPAK